MSVFWVLTNGSKLSDCILPAELWLLVFSRLPQGERITSAGLMEGWEDGWMEWSGGSLWEATLHKHRKDLYHVGSASSSLHLFILHFSLSTFLSGGHSKTDSGHHSQHSLSAKSTGLKTQIQKHTDHLSHALPSHKPPIDQKSRNISVRTSKHLQYPSDKCKSKNVVKGAESNILLQAVCLFSDHNLFYPHEFEAEYHKNMRCETPVLHMLGFKQYTAQITVRFFSHPEQCTLSYWVILSTGFAVWLKAFKVVCIGVVVL